MANKSTAKKQNATQRKVADFGNVRASYDVARTTTDNANLWGNTDNLSAAQANNPAVRKVIRERARYEVANNSYADGIIDTIVSDLLGPWITIKLGISDNAKRAEKAFQKWALESRFWQKLHVMVRAKKVDGETFALLTDNPKLRNGVTLNVQPIECDQVESYWNLPSENEIDGIKFDQYKNPVAYRILKYHPGDYRTNLKTTGGDWTDAKFVIHFFACLRPGQVRGVSELTPALNLFGQLRGYTVSVLEAASRAAEVAGILYTDLVPETDEGKCAADVEPGSIIPSGRNKIVSAPEGWRFEGFKAEQPTTTYPMFKREIIGEMGRCVNLPFNVAAADSSSYNYASGRLDHQTSGRSNETERFMISCEILDRVWAAFLSEYKDVARLTADQVSEIETPEWFFTGRGHVDPKKEADADDVRLKNGTLSLTNYFSSQGLDSQQEIEKMLQEHIDIMKKWKELLKVNGLPENTPIPNSQPKSTTPQPVEVQDDEEEPAKNKPE